MHTQPIFPITPVVATDVITPGLAWLFIGLDLAPNNHVESGWMVIDRNRALVQQDKLLTEDEIFVRLKALGPLRNQILVIDVPKSLGVSGKWRQEEVRMHALRMLRTPITPELAEHHQQPSRTARRARLLFDRLSRELPELCVLLTFNGLARLRYQMWLPFKSRSSQGSRAMQAAIRHQLGLMTTFGGVGSLVGGQNLAPLCILDAAVAAYGAWLAAHGEDTLHYKLFRDEENRLFIEPLRRLEGEPMGHRGKRRLRRFSRPRYGRGFRRSRGEGGRT
jgi:hypothetical protein